MKYILLFVLLVSTVCSAQEGASLRGKVIDARDEEPMPRVKISFSADLPDGKHTNFGAFTDSAGMFSLSDLPAGIYEVEIRMVGYDSLIISADLQSSQTNDMGVIRLSEKTEENDVVVTSDRYFTAIEDACCNVEAINREFADLAPFSPSPTQLLRRYSSCTSSKINCSIDNSSSIRLRGLEGSRVLMHVDGLPLFGALTSMYALQQIPSTAIANLKIYEGVSSAQYGNGAISGVVDFEIKPPAEPNQFDLITNVASGLDHFGAPQRDISASYVGGLSEDVGIAGFLSYNGKGRERGDNSTFTQTPQYDRLSAFAKSRFIVSAKARITLGVLAATEKRSGGEDSAVANHYNENINTSRIDAYSKIDLNLSESANLFGALLFSHAIQDSRYGSLPFDASQNILHSQAHVTDLLGDHGIKYGGELRNEKLTERTSIGAGYNFTTFGLFAEDEWQFFSRWKLLAGLRFDHHTYAGSLVSPRAALSYRISDNVKLRFATGQGFKGQALFNEEHLILHGVYRYRANEKLGYEKSWTYNFDAAWDYVFGDVAGTVNAIGYYTTITDRAAPHPDSLASGLISYINSGKSARLIGFEMQTRPKFSEHWSGALGIGIVRYEQMNAQNIYEPIPLAPQFSIDLSLMYSDPGTGWTAESWASIIGKQALPIKLYALSEAPEYALVNLRVSKQFGSVTIFSGLLNILDARQDAFTPTAIKLPSGNVNSTGVWGSLEGREIFLGVKLTL